VNQSWSATAEQFSGQAVVAVSDNEVELRRVLLERAEFYGACNRHCVGDVAFHLWKAGLTKVERDVIVGEIKGVLHTLHSSVCNHVVDGDFARLSWRIDWVLFELKRIGSLLSGRGLVGVAKFIFNTANYMVTYARLVMSNISVPWTNNLIERLMGEIAKRIKHKWMHWSERGLLNLLNILLTRYCNKRVYGELRAKFLGSNGVLIGLVLS
jgi:hypothetical protein